MRRAAAAVLAAVALAAVGCGGGGGGATTARTTAPPPAPTAPEPSAPPPHGPEDLGTGLTIGLAENNAALLGAPGSGLQPRPEMAAWRDRVDALRPQLYRLAIDWAGLQPDPSQSAQLDKPVDGCMRGAAPCDAYAGIRQVLAAIASRQAAGHGFGVVVVFMGVPDWAAAPPSGCERPGIQPRSRPITDQGLAAYHALVRRVAELARSEGAEIRWWSPWNEPNGAFFISPQRAACSTASPPVSAAVYARLYRAMRDELAGVPGDQRLVVGELAGTAEGGPRGTGSGEFLGALPDDVVCSAAIVAQHAYADLPGQKTRPGDPVAETERALAARPCAAAKPIWITETGVGGLHAGDERDTGPAALARQCVALDRELRRWRRDPRIQAAFQYTFREDPLFPVGLADAGLTRTYPTYDLIKAWSRRDRADDPPPPRPDGCRL